MSLECSLKVKVNSEILSLIQSRIRRATSSEPWNTSWYWCLTSKCCDPMIYSNKGRALSGIWRVLVRKIRSLIDIIIYHIACWSVPGESPKHTIMIPAGDRNAASTCQDAWTPTLKVGGGGGGTWNTNFSFWLYPICTLKISTETKVFVDISRKKGGRRGSWITDFPF